MSFFEKIGLKNLFGKKSQDNDNNAREENILPTEPVEIKKNETPVTQITQPPLKTVISTDIPRASSAKRKNSQNVAKFYFKENIYILSEFDICFGQETDRNGYPDGLPKGGIMKMVLNTPPDDAVNEWMGKENLLCDGEIRFLSGKGKVEEGANLIIYFKDAYCISYKKEINPEKGLFTALEISPRYVKIGNEEFENNWKAERSHSFYIRSN